MATPPQSARTKASRIRKALAKGEANEIDQLWLAHYDEQTNGSGNYGASASKKQTHKTETVIEEAAAVGTGSAAVAAAGLALAAKEEGRRLDSLTVSSIAALKEAVGVYKEITLSLRDQLVEYRKAHTGMMETMTAHYLARVEAEAELMQKEKADDDDDDGGAKAMMLSVIAKKLGLDDVAAPKNGATTKKKTA